ncbi:MAG: hypothetical protein OEX07_12965, partial [Gammaproteobacteria bacterium]|nr:hypothetical protein [Gammaproteobacteria bacterium]
MKKIALKSKVAWPAGGLLPLSISIIAMLFSIVKGDWFNFGLISAISLLWLWRFAIVSKAVVRNKQAELDSENEFKQWHRLVTDLSTAMNREFVVVKADLEQAKDIVADVIGELQGSFNDLNQQARSQTNLVLEVVHTL